MQTRKSIPAIAALLVMLWTVPALAVTGLPQFTELAERTGAAVVNIHTVKIVDQSKQMQDFFRFHKRGTPFDDFFKQFDELFKNRGNMKPRKERSLGSGFIISDDGYIVTNNHVVQGADEVKVKLRGKETSLDAEVIGRDPETDLALLKVDSDDDLPTLEFGDSDDAEVGQWVMAIGNPFGLDHSVTAGIISAKGRIIGSGPFDDFIQTDASINPGNSGGPLLNLDGEVIGINTAIVASGQGIGFAIPSAMAKVVIEQLKNDQKVHRGWLGITIQGVDENTAKALGLDKPRGALVTSVFDGQPAQKAGVRAGDVITQIDDKRLKDSNDLLRTIAGIEPGSRIDLTVWRSGKTIRLRAKLGERDTQKLAQGQKKKEAPSTDAVLGVALRPILEEEAAALGLNPPKGLLITDVKNGSLAQASEIRPGDVILQANQQDVATVSEFKEILEGDANDKGVLLLLIHRKGRNIVRTVHMPQ